jgi:hypothetical protein
MAHRVGRSTMLVALALLFVFASACGEPELSDEAKETPGSGDPTASTGSPAPGIPPTLPSGVPPG